MTDHPDHDLGHGILLRWDPDGLGFAWSHPSCSARPNKARSAWLTLRLRPEGTGHQLAAGGPSAMAQLTIAGSLLCPACKACHGHIRRGRWVPA